MHKMAGNIVLCGFMGCGKTCVGRRAARLMKRRFCDIDSYIEEKEGMTISEIFARYGEEGFRQREAQAVKELADTGDMVVACGGGTVLRKENVEAFHRGGGVILLLRVPLAVLQKRLKNDTKRPLLQKPDREKVVADLFFQRAPLYKAAADQEVWADAPPWLAARRVAATGKRLLEKIENSGQAK